jgi:hypothetical protein|tara:strand:- start:201 stop:392 length:192 start_codon:yes stop_codon:yes gene_type:complete
MKILLKRDKELKKQGHLSTDACYRVLSNALFLLKKIEVFFLDTLRDSTYGIKKFEISYWLGFR